jgi:sulfur carrier protein
MNVRVNGEFQELPDNLTVTGLLEELGYAEGGASVRRNGERVPDAQHAEITVNDGDHIEIKEGGRRD